MPKIPEPKAPPPPPTYADFAVDNAGSGLKQMAAARKARRSVLDDALPTLTSNKTLLGQ